MKGTKIIFSRKSDEWCTPMGLFAELEKEFPFGVDAAATDANRLCYEFCGPDHPDPLRRDALAAEWTPGVWHWCNPPYSKCREFVEKAAHERRRGVPSVMLVPARTDTRWFHAWLWDRTTHRPRTGIEIRFLKGRLRFEGAPSSAPFPSMIVIFWPEKATDEKRRKS